MTKHENCEELKSFALGNGASLLGAASIAEFKDRFPLLPENSPDSAVSIAFRLSKAVLDTIKEGPTQLYFQHYRQANYFLDNLALRITNFIQERGHEAMPVPASQVIDRENQRGHLCHRAVARAAGLGRIGRNNLLVTPEFGSSVRLATVLTDMPLEHGRPPANDSCGECRKCAGLCPAGAIGEGPGDFDRKACFEQLDYFRKKCQVGHHICGICVKACTGEKS